MQVIIEVSRAISAPAPVVAATVLDFAALDSWHPLVDTCTGDADERVFSAGGALVTERRTGGTEQSVDYTITESPHPIADYTATLSVHPDGTGCSVRWTSSLTLLIPEAQTQVQAGFTAFYEAGLAALEASHG